MSKKLPSSTGSEDPSEVIDNCVRGRMEFTEPNGEWSASEIANGDLITYACPYQRTDVLLAAH